MSSGFGNRGHGHRHGRRGPERQNENCVCPACSTVIGHQRGHPCFQTACPKCGAAMTRQFHTEFTAPVKSQEEAAKPVVSLNFCTGCGKCLSVCAFGAIKMIEQKAVINPAACTNCRACIPACPVSAIH